MTTTPPVAPDRAPVPLSTPDTLSHLPTADADTFSHGILPQDTEMTLNFDSDTDMTNNNQDDLSIPTATPPHDTVPPSPPTPTTDVTSLSSSDTLATTPPSPRPPSPNWADTVDDDHDDDDDHAATTLPDTEVPSKDYSIHAQFRLNKATAHAYLQPVKDLVTEMMRLDSSLKIHVYDRATAGDFWPLASAADLPANDTDSHHYFVHPQFNQQKTSVSLIFRVTSCFSHVEWRKLLTEYTSAHRIFLKQHKLDALETTCIGFLAKKHPHYTHLNHFEAYLRDTLPDTTPQFTLRHLKPRVPASFSDAVQTEVIGIQTSKEHASLLEDIFNCAFPLNTKDREYFVSYRAKPEDDQLRSLYRLQNQWLDQVRIIKIGAARNIDKKVNVGLSYHVSLREFIREQPADPDNFHSAMDVDNGGRDGKPVIIVLPKNLRAAESVYTDFTELVKLHSPPLTTQRSGHASFPSVASSHDPAYEAKLAEFLETTTISNDSVLDATATESTSASQLYLTPSFPHRARNSSKTSTSRRSTGRSYAAVTRSSSTSPAPISTSPSTASPTSHFRATASTSPPPSPSVVADPDSTVSTMTNAQQSDLLLEMHAMLKEQRHEIKKLKKRHEHSKRTTIDLQNRLESLCDSLDELSRRTMDSDLSSAALSSALSLMSSNARADDSSDSLDSKDCPKIVDSLSSRPSKIIFSTADFCAFDKNDPPIDIRNRQHLSEESCPPSSSISPSPDSWSTPKLKKKSNRSLHAVANPPLLLTTDNPFSPLDDDRPSDDSTPTLTSLGQIRSPSKKPAQKKLRRSPTSPVASPHLPTCNTDTTGPTSPPLFLPDTPDHNMLSDDDTPFHPNDDVLPMNESVDASL
jgi:hypothetical protein